MHTLLGKMSQPPPDPIHILHNPCGPVTALTTVRMNEESEPTLVSGSESGAITIWNLNVYRPTVTWQAHKTAIVWLGALECAPGCIISHGRGESLTIWNSEGKIVHQPILVNHEGFCKCDLQANIIAIPVGKSSIDIYNIEQVPERMRTLTIDGDEGGLMAIKLLGNKATTRVVAAYESGCICIWDGDVVLERARVPSMPTCLGHHTLRNELLLGTSSETLHIFDVDKLAELKAISLTNPGLNVIALRLSDLRLYATAGWDKRIRLFSARTHKKLCVLQLHDESLNSLVFIMGHCGLLAAGGSDALISLWDLYGGSSSKQQQNPP